MKIVLISPHFKGHSNVLKNFEKTLNIYSPWYETQYIELDWRTNSSKDPKVFCLENAKRDLEYLEKSIQDIGDVAFIIYDFFAISGLLLAKKNRIQSVCSIPAILKTYDRLMDEDKKHISKYKLGLSEPTLISDGYLFKGDYNIAHSYHSLYDKTTDIEFLGDSSLDISNRLENYKNCYYDEKLSNSMNASDWTNIIYVSFGTVVPTLGIDEKIEEIFDVIENYYGNSDTYQDADRVIISYPTKRKSRYRNIKYLSYCDQKDMLRRAKLFITHGGGNSVTEAMTYNVPMLVIPFFGDQFDSAFYVEKKAFGWKACDSGEEYTDHSTKYTKHVNYDESQLIRIFNEINDKSLFITKCNIESAIPYNQKEQTLIKISQIFNNFVLLFNIGKDLLYGTTEQRKKFAKDREYSHIFHVGEKNKNNEYLLVDELGITPSLIDHWNDLIKSKDPKDMNPITKEYYDTIYKIYGDPSKIQNDGKDIIDICCIGADFFLSKGCKIHFILDNIANTNYGTLCELEYLSKSRYTNSIILWYNNVAYPLSHLPYLGILDAEIDKTIKEAEIYRVEVEKIIRSVIGNNIHLQSRVKNKESIKQKMRSKLISFSEIDDILGFRIIYPWSAKLYNFADAIRQRMCIDKIDIREKNKIIYLYSNNNYRKVPLEIQLWPTIFYHVFESEHDEYKYSAPVSKNRSYQHALQDIIDTNYIWI